MKTHKTVADLQEAYDAMARDLQFRTEQVRELQEENARLRKELAAMRNELCYKCGNYEQAHNGWCDHCRWKKEA